MAYKVIQINQQEERTDLEPLGTKSKFWYSREGGKWLFKYSRENTGEHWSEKCAAEICKAMDISHVEYELAKADNQWGVTSANFVPEGATLLMGNQLLASFDKDYESPSRDGRPSSSPLYTVEEVVKCLTHFERDE